MARCVSRQLVEAAVHPPCSRARRVDAPRKPTAACNTSDCAAQSPSTLAPQAIDPPRGPPHALRGVLAGGT